MELDSVHEGSYERLTVIASNALWGTCLVFSGHTIGLWFRMGCLATTPRHSQHELLSSATTAVAAMSYMTMAHNIGIMVYPVTTLASFSVEGSSVQGDDSIMYRQFFPARYVMRMAAMSLVVFNLMVLAREKRPIAVGTLVLLAVSVHCLYLSNAYSRSRWCFFWSSLSCYLVVVCLLMCGGIGRYVRGSRIQTAFRFLSTWVCVCGLCYYLLFLCSEMYALVDLETDILLHAILDIALFSVSSIVLSCNMPQNLEDGLLIMQQTELSLYPGPHKHGFFPNPDYYDDNI